MSEINIPFTSHIESRVLVAILEELKLATRPFVGERVFLRELGYSVVVDSINEFNQIEGYSIVRDDVNLIISEYFPLRVLYDMSPVDPFQLGDSIKLKLSNFRAIVNEEETRIYKLEVNDTDITNSGSIEIDIFNTSVLRILVESKGLVSYIEREIKFLYPTYIFFSSNKSQRTIPPSAIKFDNAGALNIVRKSINNTTSGCYLYIVSGYRPEYVKTGDMLEFAIEGEVYYDDGNKVIWRSDMHLNEGQWILTVK